MITIIVPIPVLTERHAIILRECSQVLLQGDVRDDLIGAVTYTCLVNGHELVLHYELGSVGEDFGLIDHSRLPALVRLTPHCEQFVIDIRRADLFEALAAEPVSSTPAKDVPGHARLSIELIEAEGPVVDVH